MGRQKVDAQHLANDIRWELRGEADADVLAYVKGVAATVDRLQVGVTSSPS